DLLANWRDGRVKLFVTHVALALRRTNPELMRRGGYIPLAAEGSAADHLFAFARVGTGGRVVVAVPRFAAMLGERTGASVVDAAAWGDTRIHLPAGVAGGAFNHAFTGALFSGES